MASYSNVRAEETLTPRGSRGSGGNEWGRGRVVTWESWRPPVPQLPQDLAAPHSDPREAAALQHWLLSSHVICSLPCQRDPKGRPFNRSLLCRSLVFTVETSLTEIRVGPES